MKIAENKFAVIGLSRSVVLEGHKVIAFSLFFCEVPGLLIAHPFIMHIQGILNKRFTYFRGAGRTLCFVVCVVVRVMYLCCICAYVHTMYLVNCVRE